MGNTNVTPAASVHYYTPYFDVTPTDPTSEINPDTSADPTTSTNADISPTHTIPVTSRASVISVTSPTSAVPVTSRTSVIHVTSPIPTIPVTSRTSVISVASPIPVTSRASVIHVTSPTPIVPLTLRNSVVSVTSPTPAVPLTSRTPVIPVTSPIPVIPVTSRASVIHVTSPTPVIPVTPHTSTIPIFSTTPLTARTPEIPVTSPTPTITNIRVKSVNFIPVASPDISAVSPTLESPAVSIKSPTPTVVAATRANSITSIRPPANNIFTSHTIPVVPTTNISKTPLPIEVAPKRAISKISISPPIPNAEQIHSTTLSSAERWYKWNRFEQKQQEKHKGFIHIPEQAKSFDLSTPLPPPDIDDDEDRILTPVVPDIIAVPSFRLRSTAVNGPSQDNGFLSERTKSIHTEISIFKYYLTQKDPKHSIGSHTQATMFKMDTRLKQTPLPTPSLSFLTKNFSDGTNETEDTSTTAPTFVSLGLQNDLPSESPDPSSTRIRLDEKQQRKVIYPSSFADINASSNDSFPLESSTTSSQPNFPAYEKPPVQASRQPLASILKKTTSQVVNNPHPIQNNRKIFEELQKNDFENHPSIVSFKIPVPSKKASQSISRSERLFASRSFHRKK